MKKIGVDERVKIKEFLIKYWGTEIIVSNGKIHKASELNGFCKFTNNRPDGIILFEIQNNCMEIVYIEAFNKLKGLGTEMLNLAINEAERQNLEKIWLVTTNDNLDAIRFYQKRGFDISFINRNALEQTRKIKPDIPKYGFYGIEIKHEIGFIMALSGR